MRRDAGKPGDLVVVTGKLGSAAAGLESLRSTKADPRWQKDWKRPRPRLEEGVALRDFGILCAGDVSDGLIVDAARTGQASHCGVELWLDRVPVDRKLKELFPRKWQQLALGGGEDFELVVTVKPGNLVALLGAWDSALAPLTVVGRLFKGEGLRLLDQEGGKEIPAPAVKSRHYA